MRTNTFRVVFASGMSLGLPGGKWERLASLDYSCTPTVFRCRNPRQRDGNATAKSMMFLDPQEVPRPDYSPPLPLCIRPNNCLTRAARV